MKKYTLIEALVLISVAINCDIKEITMIEFEDGSGRNFNYSLGNNKRFIRL